MGGRNRIFIGIVVAMMGSCGGTDDGPAVLGASEDGLPVAALVPLDESHVHPAPGDLPAAWPAEVHPPPPARVHPPFTRSIVRGDRVRVRDPRRPIREAWITGGSDFPQRRLTPAQRNALEKPREPLEGEAPGRPAFAPVLRAAPSWRGR